MLHFIQRLLGIIQPFNTAEEALHTLLQLPESSQSVLLASAEVPLEEDRKANRIRLILAIAFLMTGLIGFVGWLTLKEQPFRTTTSPTPSQPTRSLEEVRIASIVDAPSRLTYVVEPRGAWHYAMARQFVSNHALGVNVLPQNLIEAIENRHSQIAIDPAQSVEDINVINQLVSREADVAFMTQPDNELESLGLEKQTVAHDALVVFVPFSDPYHFNKTLAVQEMNRSISIEELRQLYTSDTATDTVQFPGQQFRVKLFFSEDGETVRHFERQVLENNAALIEKFRRLRARAKARDEQAAKSDRAPNDVYNRIWSDANQSQDRSIINIGFDRLGRMFDQCSVYPLAIRNGVQERQVLVRSNGSVIDRDIDLCGEKGSYLPNIQNYPLTYNLDLVYRKGSRAGSALADMLKTTEGQYLMSEVGLIPQQPIPQLLSEVWGEAND
ncbi:MAG: hypothetical protein HC895_09190 [Leptolyngbyaceae cyanobacterium SM1_3_5]|nr:hypothetical protein [Leptolyngbyaceae cyanobacterium SM1_3_5]